jgi:hypothetical protein
MSSEMMAFRFYLVCFLLFSWTMQIGISQERNLYQILQSIPGISSLESVREDSVQQVFHIAFSQPIDHRDESKGFFEQKVSLIHRRNFDSPLVFETEGYVLRNASANELTLLLDGNQIKVEHRYFGESVPADSMFDWKYLNAWQASMDYHRIVSSFRSIYFGKWIGTGISKGGQTALLHRMYFPSDVDMTVAYVAPLNFSGEDKRIERFLRKVGDPDCRKRILQFQKLLLQKKEVIMPFFREYAENRGFEFRLDLGEIYELAVLEFPVSYWQWGFPCQGLPTSDQEPFQIFMFLASTGSIDFLSTHKKNSYEPAFYQFFNELGFYGYSMRGLRPLLRHLHKPSLFFLGPREADLKFDVKTMKELDRFIRTRAERTILIYGENDPWSATAVNPGKNSGVSLFLKAKGNHSVRIRNLPDYQRVKIVELITEWLDS